jgi:HSP20 family protein
MSQTTAVQKSGEAKAPARHGFADQFLDPFNRLRSEFDRMFDDFPMRTLGPNLTRRIQSISGPALEFKDKDNEYELIAEVPGLKADQIEIKVAEGVLRLSGERKEERQGKEDGFLFSERHYGHFERAIQLPAGVDEDKITANAQDGLLSIHLPKTPDAQQREKKIPVQSG